MKITNRIKNKFKTKIKNTLSVNVATTLILLAAVSNCAQVLETEYTATIVGTPTHNVGGKSIFQIKITDQDEVATSGLTVTVTPWMTMTSMKHTTPISSATDKGSGIYEFTAHYLMPSTSGSWKLHVNVGSDEIAQIDITVNGMMNHKGSFLGATIDPDKDMITMPPGARPYWVWKDAINVTNPNSTLTLFIGVRQSKSSHLYLAAPQTLTGGDTNLAVNSVKVEIANEDPALGTVETWTALDGSANDGTYSGTNLTLPGDNKLYIRLTVSGAVKNRKASALTYVVLDQ